MLSKVLSRGPTLTTSTSVILILLLLTLLSTIIPRVACFTTSFSTSLSLSSLPRIAPPISTNIALDRDEYRDRCLSPLLLQRAPSTALSGIRGFRSWFSSTFPTSYRSIDTTTDFEEFDHVLIDMNQILHIVLRRRQDEDKALLAMFKELDDTLRYAKPRRCVVFSFDGPPSAAKLATQRGEVERGGGGAEERKTKQTCCALYMCGMLRYETAAPTYTTYKCSPTAATHRLPWKRAVQ